MALRRKILLGLLVLPLAAIFIMLAFPGAITELIFLILGVPVLVINIWEFFLREGGGSFFDLSPRDPALAGMEGSVMKSKWLVALLILSAVFILLVIGYTASQSVMNDVPYFTVLFGFLTKLGTKLWHFFTIPLIFIVSLLFLLALVFIPLVLSALKKEKGTEAASFPDVFSTPKQSPFAEIVSQSEENESILAMERMIGEGIDLKAIQLLLEVDGIDLTKPYLLSKITALEIHSEGLAAEAGPAQKAAFYHGVLEGLYGYLFPLFCTIETKNEDRVARFTLKPGMRDRLMRRLNEGNRPSETVTV